MNLTWPAIEQLETLIHERKQAGHHEIRFQASTLASGIYYYLIKAGNFREVRKMILVK